MGNALVIPGGMNQSMSSLDMPDAFDEVSSLMTPASWPAPEWRVACAMIPPFSERGLDPETVVPSGKRSENATLPCVGTVTVPRMGPSWKSVRPIPLGCFCADAATL